MFRFTWQVLLAISAVAQAAEVSIGSFPLDSQHLVAGEVVALSERVLEIRGFAYDGQAPDAFFWLDESPIATAGGTILQDGAPLSSCGSTPLPLADGTQTFRVEFPPGSSILDYLGGSLSIWCRQFSANFGQVNIPATLDGLKATEEGPLLECSETPTLPPMEVSLGSLVTREHLVSGEVVLLSESVFEVRQMSYDGLGPDAYFWIDTSAIPTASGSILLDAAPTGSCGTEILPAASDQTFRVEFPAGTTINDYLGGSISIWCRQAGANFGEIVIPDVLSADLATTSDGPPLACSAPEPVSLGSLFTREHLVSGEVFALSDTVLEVRGFTFDGDAPDTYFWLSEGTPSADGIILLEGEPTGSCGTEPLPAANGNQTYRVELPDGLSLLDFPGGSISLWCRQAGANFGEILLDGASFDGIASTARGPPRQCTAGVALGSLTTREHLVSGDVFALSDRVLEVRNFNYDGLGPDSFFWVDSGLPSMNGSILPEGSPTGSCGTVPLPEAQGDTYRVEFPEGKTLQDYAGGTLSVWCRQAQVNFGELVIKTDLSEVPSLVEGPRLECSPNPGDVVLGNFTTVAHDVSGQVIIVSERVLEVKGLVFDGDAPDTYFWASENSIPTADGYILREGAPANTCGSRKLPAADGSQTYRVEFPEGMSILDFLGGSISLWCRQAGVNFGSVEIPSTLPNITLTEDGPELQCEPDEIAVTPEGYNCESLHPDFQVRWQIQDDVIAVELVGLIDENVYMGFGVSGDQTQTNMIGSDPVVADVFGGEPRAFDFYMNSRAQCSNGDGVCPDTDGLFTDDISDISGEQDAGITVVRYKKPLLSTDVGSVRAGETVDVAIDVTPGVSSFIVWALGPIDLDRGLPFFHTIGYPGFGDSPRNVQIEFGRQVADNCVPLREVEEPEGEVVPFERPVIRDTTTLNCHIGPSGGPRGYEGISGGRTGWGIAWYVNDLLVPVIEMVRGTTYTFVVNGGDDPSQGSRYHPFYITDSIDGGWAQRTPAEREGETPFAGLTLTSDAPGFIATIEAPICLYDATPQTPAAQTTGTYEEYFATLETSCARDPALMESAAILEFTPDENTPDLLYYQCVTHRNLGWEIRVVDPRDDSIEVDCSGLQEERVQLAEDLTMNVLVNTVENTMTVRLTRDGLGWIGMGFTDGEPSMVGAESVIGLPNTEDVSKYSMTARAVPGVNKLNSQTLTDTSIVQENGQTIMTFTKILTEPGEHPISATEENTFLYAMGPSNEFGPHEATARGAFTLRPRQCVLTRDGEVINAAFTSSGGTGVVDEVDTKPLWIAHGICASISWAILVPLAVGSSIVRGFFELLGMGKGTWFQVHRILNTLAIALTLVAFGLAVRAINLQPGGPATHFSLIAHHSVGLAITLIAVVQGVVAIFRPHLPHTPSPDEKVDDIEGGEEEQSKIEPEEKSQLRFLWEIKHRIFGAVLLIMAWWQVQDGIGLFFARFGEGDLRAAFWGVVGGIIGGIVLLKLYTVSKTTGK